MIHAIAAGCTNIRPVVEVNEARELAASLAGGRVLLAGERGGQPIAGFDCGNSPGEFTAERCGGKIVVFTTGNGTRALLHACAAEHVLIGAFVNCRAVCEQLQRETRPIHVVCAGESGRVALEDTLFAGAVVDFLCASGHVPYNDGALVARDCFRQRGAALAESLALGAGGARLRELGYDDDIRAAARVDAFALVPELRRHPLRVEAGAAGGH
jgi:2-phosphosulfolactate phosphatase